MAIKAINQRPMINSISGEQERLEQLLPLVAKLQYPVIVHTLDNNGIPKTADDGMNIIDRLVTATRKLDTL